MAYYDLVAIGSSWGGLYAVTTILEGLPGDFPAAIAVAQHQTPNSDQAFVNYLRPRSRLPVWEVEDKQPIAPGNVFVGPPDYHLMIDEDHFTLSIDERVQYSRPSIDVLFESAADVYRNRLIAVVLTGANADGAEGIERVRARGGVTVVQDPATAMRKEMPSAAIATGKVDRVLPLNEIPAFLTQLCSQISGPQRSPA